MNLYLTRKVPVRLLTGTMQVHLKLIAKKTSENSGILATRHVELPYLFIDDSRSLRNRCTIDKYNGLLNRLLLKDGGGGGLSVCDVILIINSNHCILLTSPGLNWNLGRCRISTLSLTAHDSISTIA